MAWCRQATSHCLSQCWPRFLSPYDVTRHQWVNYVCKWAAMEDTTIFSSRNISLNTQYKYFCMSQAARRGQVSIYSIHLNRVVMMNVVKLYLFVAHAIPLSLYNQDIINVKLVPKMGLHGCTHYTVMDFKSNVMLETTTASILLLGFVRTRVLMSRSRLNNGATHGGWHFDIHRYFDTRGR